MADRNMFEVATRKKYRFVYNGEINIEDLWDVPLEDLDKIYATLRAQYKQADNVDSLMSKNDEKWAVPMAILEDKIAIVKHIFDVRQAEINAAKDAQANAQFNQKILEIIAQKENADLQNKSVDELKAMLK